MNYAFAKLLLARLSFLLNDYSTIFCTLFQTSVIRDHLLTSNVSTSKITLLGNATTYNVGDTVRIELRMFDGYGIPKATGGDLVSFEPLHSNFFTCWLIIRDFCRLQIFFIIATFLIFGVLTESRIPLGA